MAKSGNNRADWSNYWQGRTAGDSGEVFAGVGIETSEELAKAWRSAFDGLGEAIVLDVACGAGSALKHAQPFDDKTLIALDISEHALATARRAVPTLLGLVSSADRLPIAAGSVDRVVSQFGFEYADRPAASEEIARVLKPGGRFQAITHLSGGAIAQECEGHIAHINSLDDSRYIPATKAMFTALDAADRDPSDKARTAVNVSMGVFQKAQAAILPAIQAGGLAAHLHGGARQLFERRRGYDLSDITGWLDGMAAEIAAYRGRMEGMLGAAISIEEARALASTVQTDGNASVAPMTLGGQPCAIWIDARKAG